MTTLYQDSSILVATTHILIKKYYLPLCTSKTILYSELAAVQFATAVGIDHTWGTYGSLTNNWFNFDSNRDQKNSFIEFHLKEGGMRPSVTPEHPKAVFNILNHIINGNESQKEEQESGWYPKVSPFKLGPLVPEVDIDSITLTADSS